MKPTVLVDHNGWRIGDGAGTLLGIPPTIAWPPSSIRLLAALPLNRNGGLHRYGPPHPAGEQAVFALSYERIVPALVGLQSGALSIFTNVANPVASSDFTVREVTVAGRTLYSELSGGVDGTDYQLRWSATDTSGNIWPRTALLLCARTS